MMSFATMNLASPSLLSSFLCFYWRWVGEMLRLTLVCSYFYPAWKKASLRRTEHSTGRSSTTISSLLVWITVLRSCPSERSLHYVELHTKTLRYTYANHQTNESLPIKPLNVSSILIISALEEHTEIQQKVLGHSQNSVFTLGSN